MKLNLDIPLVFAVVSIVFLILLMAYNTLNRAKKKKMAALNSKKGGPRVQETFRKNTNIHYYNVAKNESREIEPISDTNKYKLRPGLNFSELKRKNR